METTALDLTTETANKILEEVMNFRRIPGPHKTCENSQCTKCSSIHLPKIITAIQQNKSIPFVLPAFPGKSPNEAKVLSPLPDQAERLSLAFLDDLNKRIKKFYSPGIQMILCSDGRVFSDVVGMQESHVTDYQDEIHKLIEEMSLTSITTFNLDDFYGNIDFTQMRDELMGKYGASLEALKVKVREDEEAHRMYCGITRFLFEDALTPGQSRSRASIQKEARTKAYEVIRRSNAWSELIAERFPEAVRLSIHPQTCGSKKLGIRLIGNESWMTPWHGVAVATKNGHVLLKRSEAEALGAQLVYSRNGRPSHFELISDQVLPMTGA